MSYCKKCGYKYEESDNFCEKCGNALNKEAVKEEKSNSKAKISKAEEQNPAKLIMRWIMAIAISWFAGKFIYFKMAEHSDSAYKELFLIPTGLLVLLIAIFVFWMGKDWRLFIAFPIATGAGVVGAILASGVLNQFKGEHYTTELEGYYLVGLCLAVGFIIFCVVFGIIFKSLGAKEKEFKEFDNL